MILYAELSRSIDSFSLQSLELHNKIGIKQATLIVSSGLNQSGKSYLLDYIISNKLIPSYLPPIIIDMKAIQNRCNLVSSVLELPKKIDEILIRRELEDVIEALIFHGINSNRMVIVDTFECEIVWIKEFIIKKRFQFQSLNIIIFNIISPNIINDKYVIPVDLSLDSIENTTNEEISISVSVSFIFIHFLIFL